MEGRKRAVEVASHRLPVRGGEHRMVADRFGRRVFHRRLMEKVLPKPVFENVRAAQEGRGRINLEYAETIATAMKEWAASLGATHYSHWFAPLTGAPAEKHDSFIMLHDQDHVIERFGGNQLIQGEPDASSFPSGGLRSTFEARGYTGWDPTSLPFIWEGGDGITLCVPSVFYSWTGNVLDSKIPLLRSDEVLNRAALRLLKLTGTPATQVYSTLGWEQEYFVVDRALRALRPDLLLLGKTVCGAPSPKGQELEDHYFRSVRDRVLSFMQEFEAIALELGIAVKTRHNEVAPAQHEVAAHYERASRAVDHNQVTMALMQQVAERHQLACLFHEKPFQGLNGSGKHCNWSLATDTGLNLLDPGETPETRLCFLLLLGAVLDGVHRHADLLRASIGSASNDERLGGHEAPPAIISVYLGEALERLLEAIEQHQAPVTSQRKSFDLNVPAIPAFPKDNTDRNRTSPFAFTGNKFEFRAVGASAHCALPITVLNLIVAESLNQMCDAIEGRMSQLGVGEAAMEVLRETVRRSHPIRFTGDNYSQEWRDEAARRGLPQMLSSVEAFGALRTPKAKQLFREVLTPQELESRAEILLDQYAKTRLIEANLLIEMAHTQLIPAAMASQQQCADSIRSTTEVLGLTPHQQIGNLRELTQAIEGALKAGEQVEKSRHACRELATEQQAHFCCQTLKPQMVQLRSALDRLETLTIDTHWPIPKYRELLFVV
jgi:glutamine synthetase